MSTSKFWEAIIERIQRLYLADAIPWVVGYSGGKDSTATLQLVWIALSQLLPEQRKKPVAVISTDTLVEQPIVAEWVRKSLEEMESAAQEQGLPITTHRLTPALEDRYWVNLIGKGFAAPRSKFRWCTDRLKIKASNQFIRDMVQENGEAILVLGTRKAESTSRAKVMEKYENQRTRDWLSPNGSLSNSYVFSPIEEWDNDSVWLFLLQVKNPWSQSGSNKPLLAMYQGATDGGECPLVVGEINTPSCGSSRFGCYVCTMVSHDRSMGAMIANDSEKQWLLPLVLLRDEIARMGQKGKPDDYDVRDFRRTGGGIKLFRNTGMPIPGPYTREHRHYLLKKVLETDKLIKETGKMSGIEVIGMEEIIEIRRLWLERYEWEDAVPRIYEEVYGTPLPVNDYHPEQLEEWELLHQVVGDDPLAFELAYSLLGIEASHSLFSKGSKLEKMTNVIRKCYYTGADDAAAMHRKITGWKPPYETNLFNITNEEGSP